jgi:ABC-type Na+ efflux pump permease subunit
VGGKRYKEGEWGKEMDTETIKWIAGISITVVLAIVGFAGRIIYQKRQEQGKQTKQKLKVHLEDMKREVTDKISEMARSMTIRHERLVTNIFPISEEYAFEKNESFEAFKIHLPQFAQEWRTLNNRAWKLNSELKGLVKKDNVITALENMQEAGHKEAQEIDLSVDRDEYETKNYEFEHSFSHLQKDLIEFSQRLSDKLEKIQKYNQFGTAFKYNKKCPICKNF